MQPATVQVTEVVASDDVELVRRARSGDRRAFEAIAAVRIDGAFRLASAILGGEADAADATQDALLAAWRQLPALREPQAFDAWFHRILVNACRMRVRSRTRRPETSLDDPAAGADPPATGDGPLARLEALDLLERGFERLDADDRAMVVLHHLEDRPLAEIADTLHMPLGTVKWRLHEARQVLLRSMEGVR